LYFYGVQDWPGGMNNEYPGIAKPFTLPASRDENRSSGDKP
jgi:hypothetical protein